MGKDNIPQAIKLTEAQADAVQKTLQYWSQSRQLSQSQADHLLSTIQVIESKQNFEWDRFAKYTFRLAIICLAIGVFYLAFDGMVPKIIARIKQLPLSLRVCITSVLAIAVHYAAYQRSSSKTEQVRLNEAFHALGALLFGLAAIQIEDSLKPTRPGVRGSKSDFDTYRAAKLKHEYIMLKIYLGLAAVYLMVAIAVQSNFICSLALLVYGVSLAVFASHVDDTFFFGVFASGVTVLCAAYLMRHHPRTATLWSTTRVWGLLYFFIGLCAMPLIDSKDMILDSFASAGVRVRARYFLRFLVSLAACATAAWHGLRYGDSTTRGFGLVFFCIYLWIGSFEFVWWRFSVPVVLIMFAVVFGLMGKYGESVNIALQRRYPELHFV
ncbi:hypothetical protein GGR57DRAFT_458978 [Xylariaceae sp. FL1272]|nr:hypothetical protein GGR57DRAFT_458978 [Xylariaceae sp. FL1272]